MQNGNSTPQAIPENLQQTADELRAKGQQMVESATSALAEKPLTAVLIGMGVGLGVGLLIAGGRGSRRSAGLGTQAMDSIGQVGQQIANSVSEAIPDMLSRHFTS